MFNCSKFSHQSVVTVSLSVTFMCARVPSTNAIAFIFFSNSICIKWLLLIYVFVGRYRRQESKSSALYPVQVISDGTDEHMAGYVRIHYVGYSAKFDEWRPLNDLVTTVATSVVEESREKFNFNTELLFKLKSSLVSQRRSNPAVKIEMTFDKRVFDEGLKIMGYLKNRKRGIDHYAIHNFSDVDSVFGRNWHYRGLNESGDFCYVICETVDFYLYKKRPMIQYINQQGMPTKVSVPRGYNLVFKFVRGDGTASQFGKLSDIFT